MWAFRFITMYGYEEEIYHKSSYYKEAITWARKRAKQLNSKLIIVLP
jgi:hypothetical protein